MAYTLIEKDNEYYVNNILIDRDTEEEVGWEIRHLGDFIDNLIGWISEATKDKELMKSDLKYLMKIEEEDTYILSSTVTNSYVSLSKDPNNYNRIMGELIDQSKI